MKKEDKEKIISNIFKFCFTVLIITFLTLYLSQTTGYYEYELHKKTVFTEEQIKKFEQDISEGKDVSIEDYINNEVDNYNNKFSKLGYYISTEIGKYVRDVLDVTFKTINKWMKE